MNILGCLVAPKYNLMQEDPSFKKLVSKSYILRQAPGLEVPLVPIRITTFHEGVATLFLTTATHFTTFMLDTIKVRIQARHINEDVAHFTRNKVDKLPVMRGVMKGYGIVLLGDAVHLSISKLYGIYVGCVAESVLKTWLEISKISTQMGKPNDFNLMKLAYRNCLPLGLCRDLIYRSVFAAGVQRSLRHQQLTSGKFNEAEHRSNIMLFSMIGAFLSHPFDVLFTKLASQRYIKYLNPVEAVQMVWKEENPSKLLGSGLVSRIMMMTFSAYVMGSFYSPLLNIVL